jgi:hypothetical protein
MWSAPPALHTGVPLRIYMDNVSVACLPLHQSTQVRVFYMKVVCPMETMICVTRALSCFQKNCTNFLVQKLCKAKRLVSLCSFMSEYTSQEYFVRRYLSVSGAVSVSKRIAHIFWPKNCVRPNVWYRYVPLCQSTRVRVFCKKVSVRFRALSCFQKNCTHFLVQKLSKAKRLVFLCSFMSEYTSQSIL